MSAIQPEPLRQLSRVVFGQEHRLELMLAIADNGDGVVTLGQMAAVLGVSPSSIQKPFHALVEAGMLTSVRTEDPRRKFYLANNSSGWAWARELAAHAEVSTVKGAPGTSKA
ncbi:winged helix-turn-helix domain-containing protein [Microbacterium sp.]|uniref:winged helix-turn-helix domain-containing protein n=1 Tax=Microbacterium sp. TaxID=51671 RepID=UPI002CDA2E0C|nr:winged helix-turn-helix domain-containing protein [Microbacterium sp.]HWL76496.1 winged helix-turn-helix domain-containing protein [Microbacterium sp.]